MTDESAIAKLYKAKAEKAKSYKVSHDVDRARSLAHLGHLLRDYPAHASLAASVGRELAAMNAKQAELDAEEKAEDEKELQEAKAADAPKPEEPKHAEDTSGTASYPSIAPSVPRRS